MTDISWISDSLDIHPGDHPASFFLGKEFILWLWWRSETHYGHLELGEHGRVDFWVDDRIAFRTDGDKPQTSTIQGGAAAASPEARSALLTGKTIDGARLGLRVHEREYSLQLKGETLDVSGLKVPGEVKDGVDERIYERMFLLEEVTDILDQLFLAFCEERLAERWNGAIVPEIRGWVADRDRKVRTRDA